MFFGLKLRVWQKWGKTEFRVGRLFSILAAHLPPPTLRTECVVYYIAGCGSSVINDVIVKYTS